MNTPLPKRLQYLKPFIRYLESLAPEDLNEDLDSTILEEALRKRLSKGDPETTLDDDRRSLEEWLGSFDSEMHPAHWILGFILGLSPADLLEVDESHERNIPTIEMDAPTGWSVSNNGAEFRKGELFAAIVPIDEFSFDALQHQMAASFTMPPPIVAHRTASPVTYGESTGYKYVYDQSAPKPWKQVDYLLKVPGGFVSIQVCAMGADFDEQEFEDRLCTLSLEQPTR